MNELRMYVEHLFEGKVLTADMIELKEEIYGNLVARYEDYVAGGMDAAEALEKTKASITSLDDVLTGDAEDAQGADGAQGRQAGSADSACSAAGETAGAGDAGAADTVRMPAADTYAASTRPAGAPMPPEAAGAPAADAPRARWPIVVGVLAAVVIIGAIGVAAFGFVRDSARSYEQDTTVQVDPRSDGQGATSSGTDTGTLTDGTSSQSGDAPVFDDPEDQREYEATMALMDQIDGTSIDMLKTYASGAGPADAGTMFGSLPLGSYVANFEYDSQNAVLMQDYQGVPDELDGEAVDQALVFNAAAVLCAYPEVQSVRLSVLEEGDDAYDTDIYQFERAVLEEQFANVSDGAVVQLNSSLFETVEQWNEVRDLVRREALNDIATDRAEVH